MLELSPQAMAALAADADQRECSIFAGWWAQHGLPPQPHGSSHSLFVATRAEARELGIDSNEDSRISVYAYACWLIPRMTGEQYLLVADAVFDHGDVARRLQLIADIAPLSGGSS